MMDSYSHKDFTGRTLIEATDMDNQIIVGSCFAQEPGEELVHCFPETMTGTIFVNSNVEGAFIPPGNQVIQLDENGYPEGGE